MKERLDVLVVKKGLASSREQARACIMAGEIYVNGVREDKAGTFCDEEAQILFKDKALPYVSRGGLKLEKALNEFSLDLKDRVCLDIGASTGGFTDCMLQNGARKVYAVDVGYGQLAYKLRTDPRVVCLEKTNVRYLTPDRLEEAGDFASVDVSFISLKLVLPALKALLKEQARLVCLVKPQFEAGRDKVGKKGVVREESVHREVLQAVWGGAEELDFFVLGLSFSPIKGPEGNIEYLLYLAKGPEEGALPGEAAEGLIRQVVELSHQMLNKEAKDV